MQRKSRTRNVLVRIVVNLSPIRTTPSLEKTAHATAQTVERAADLLFAIADMEPAGCSAAELAQRLGLPRANVYRLLAALGAKGLVRRLPADRRRYELGLRLLDLGEKVRRSLNVGQVALPFMRTLSQTTGESVYLAVRDGGQAVVVERVDSPRNLRLYATIGARMPLHAGAVSKVLLAWAPVEDVEAAVRAGLRRHTPRTITEPAGLRAHLAQIRRAGYVLSREELDVGATGIGVPVFDNTGTVVAGLSLSGPSSRFDERALPRLIREVVSTGARISTALGSVAAPGAGPDPGRGARRGSAKRR